MGRGVEWQLSSVIRKIVALFDEPLDPLGDGVEKLRHWVDPVWFDMRIIPLQAQIEAIQGIDAEGLS